MSVNTILTIIAVGLMGISLVCFLLKSQISKKISYVSLFLAIVLLAINPMIIRESIGENNSKYDTDILNINVDELSKPYIKAGKVNQQKLFSKGEMNRDIQKENLILLKDVLTSHNIKYFIESGTLLGAVRDKGFIKGDEDADISIGKHDMSKLRKIYSKLEKLGFISFRNGLPERDDLEENERSWMSMSLLRKGEYIDFYTLFDTIPFSLTLYPFLGTQFPVPYYYEEWLDELYGDWRTPDPNDRGNGSWERGMPKYVKKWGVVKENLDIYYSSNGNKEVHHLHKISLLSQKMGTPIFPRQGFLLGIVRHKGFLPNEGIDADLACFAHDVPKILNIDWGEYEFKCGANELPACWDRDFFNGNHPVTGESLKYYELIVTHKHSSWKESIGCYYKYKPGYYYYPLWSIKEQNSDNEYKLSVEIYNQKGGGNKILLGYDELPLKELYNNESYKGKVGVIHKISDLEKFIPALFYDTFIYIPTGSKNILLNEYGSNVFEYMIDKKGKKVKLNSSNSKPRKL